MEDNPYAPPTTRVADPATRGATTLYSPRQIYVASFLCGPLAGAWLFSRNLHYLQNESESRKLLVFGFSVMLALFPLFFFLPKNMPQVVVPLMYSYAFYYFAQRRFPTNQGLAFFKGWRSWLKILGINVVWLILPILFWVAAWLLTAKLFPRVLPQ